MRHSPRFQAAPPALKWGGVQFGGDAKSPAAVEVEEKSDKDKKAKKVKKEKKRERAEEQKPPEPKKDDPDSSSQDNPSSSLRPGNRI